MSAYILMLLSSRDGLKYCHGRPSGLTWGSSRRRRTYLHRPLAETSPRDLISHLDVEYNIIICIETVARVHRIRRRRTADSERLTLYGERELKKREIVK